MRVIADDASLVVTVVSSLCLSFSSRSLLLSAAVIERKQYCRSVAARRRMRNRLRNARAGRFALREPAFGNPPARSPTCEMRIVSRLPTRIIDARNIHSFAPSLSLARSGANFQRASFPLIRLLYLSLSHARLELLL